MGREAERPAYENEQPILEADQVPEVDDEPGCPGEKAAEPNSFDVGDRRCSADRGQVAHVPVAEGVVLATTQPRADDAGCVPPLLHRHGCDTRQHDGLAARLTDAHHVADREHLRMPGEAEVGFDGDASGTVKLSSSQLGEAAGEAGRGDSGSPNDHPAGDALRVSVSALERHAGTVDPDHSAACEDRYAEALQ